MVPFFAAAGSLLRDNSVTHTRTGLGLCFHVFDVMTLFIYVACERERELNLSSCRNTVTDNPYFFTRVRAPFSCNLIE
jgi:hypothetical protein